MQQSQSKIDEIMKKILHGGSQQNQKFLSIQHSRARRMLASWRSKVGCGKQGLSALPELALAARESSHPHINSTFQHPLIRRMLASWRSTAGCGKPGLSALPELALAARESLASASSLSFPASADQTDAGITELKI